TGALFPAPATRGGDGNDDNDGNNRAHDPDAAEVPGPDRRRFLALAGSAVAVIAVAGATGAALGRRAAAGITERTPLPLPGVRTLAGSAVAGIAVAGATGAGRGRRAADVITERTDLQLPEVLTRNRAAPVPAAVTPDVPGVTPFLTRNDEFYRIDTALRVPAVTSRDWRLRIHGMVEHEIELDWDALLEREADERIITLTCVSNEVGGDLVGTATWTGFPIADLLAEAGPLPDADMLLSTSA